MGERIQLTTKAGRHRPASETPFDGLGSSRERQCANSLNFRGIAIGLYRGWRGGGVICAPVFHGFHGSAYARGLCLCVCLLNFSVCLSISLSVYLSLSICLFVCMSLFLLSLSLHMWCRPSRPGIPSSIPGNSSL